MKDGLPEKGDSYSVYPTYQNYWIESKPYGHQIRIATESGTHTIDLKWPDRERDERGRVSDKWKENLK
tara:strand:+ start:102 stop:305 length:204 start_codon:yes stop_codon:yes gene_type:complete